MEYYGNRKPEFEGEYLDGLKNGFGKKYYTYGGLEFIGEYINDKPIEGKSYDLFGNLIFNGEYSLTFKNISDNSYESDMDIESEDEKEIGLDNRSEAENY